MMRSPKFCVIGGGGGDSTPLDPHLAQLYYDKNLEACDLLHSHKKEKYRLINLINGNFLFCWICFKFALLSQFFITAIAAHMVSLSDIPLLLSSMHLSITCVKLWGLKRGRRKRKWHFFNHHKILGFGPSYKGGGILYTWFFKTDLLLRFCTSVHKIDEDELFEAKNYQKKFIPST